MITRISTIFFAFALVIFMTASAAMAADDVRNSRHNLSVTGGWNITTGTGGVGYSSVDNDLGNADDDGKTTRICVFCHTPHGSAGMTSPVPLWNKNYMQPNGGYEQHDHDEVATLMGGTSLACLQCHDGTQALDVMLNLPGSGNAYTGGMMGITSGGTSAGYGFLEFDKFGEGAGLGEIANIGTNLMNDHPVNILYAEATCLAMGTPMMPMGAADCAKDDEFNGATWDDDHHIWEAGDLGFPLETRLISEFPEIDAVTSSTIGAVVGCYSCHNPHLGNWDTTGAGSPSTEGDATQMFLRVADNVGSAICLNCHVK